MECEASPIDTATPQENQRLETKHVGAKKRAFRARLPPILTFSTRYQTGWNVTKCHACHATTCLETFEKDKFASFPHRHGDATGKPETRDKTRGRRKTSISCETSSNFDIFDMLSNRLECHKSATPATQNEMTTCLDTFEKDKFASFPHRHGDASRKPETRDETRGCRKTSISCETSSNFHSWQHDKRTSFAVSPIDTARPRENQRLETRQVGAPKQAFRARLPRIFILCSFKINVFRRVFLRT